MNAKEARERAHEILWEKNNDCYIRVKQEIEEAVEEGKFVLSFFDTITDEVKDRLEKEGYQLHRTQAGINEYDWVIKW
jgi:hypothetical protein